MVRKDGTAGVEGVRCGDKSTSIMIFGDSAEIEEDGLL